MTTLSNINYTYFYKLKNDIINIEHISELLDFHGVEDNFNIGDALIFDKYVLHRSSPLLEGEIESRATFALRFSDANARYDKERALNLEYPKIEFNYGDSSDFNINLGVEDDEMDVNQCLLFISIAFFYIISPGPAVFLAINYGTIYGIKKATIMLLGNASGISIIATISALGIGVFILSSDFLLNLIKIIGFIFLFYIGFKMIISSIKAKKSRQTISSKFDSSKQYKDFYKEGLFMALSNPKPIIFFTAIYPQFLNKEGETFINLFILGFSFVFISYISLNVYAFLGKTILSSLLNDNGLRNFNLFSGITFLIMSFVMLFSKLK